MTTFLEPLPEAPPELVSEPPAERPGDPRWVRPALLTLLTSTGFLYIWGLGASGWANSFYSAAVQASTHSWKAFFFGSLDSGNSITVDKPPAFLWVMDISARIFGVNSWSILVPEALMGVAAVGLLYVTVRRHFSATAGLIAGATLALTPIATLMFRFNNPDAMLVLLLVAASYAVTRAVDAAPTRGATRWLLFAGLLVGTGFITKMMQAFLVVPAFGLAYLIAADTTLKRRILSLLAAGVAMVVASGWWVAIVELWPASSRPYIGGSQNNSLLNLIFGYNGLGRITGSETGSVGGGGGGTNVSMWGKTGLLRMFSNEFGSQAAWLIPTALLLLVAMFWQLRRAPRTDGRRAQLILWGGSLLVTGLTFSYMSGIIHPYYTVALAPATGALVGIGAVTMWEHRGELFARVALSAAVLLSSWWAWALLDRTPDWHPWLRFVVPAIGTAVALAILAAPYLNRRLAPAIAGVALVASLASPAAYSIATAATPHTGSLPTAGPSVAGGFGPGRGGAPGGAGRFPGFAGGTGGQTGGGIPNFGGFPGGGFGPGGQSATGGLPGIGGQFGSGGSLGRGLTGGAGGLLDAPTPSSALVAALEADASSYRWAAATVGSQNAAGYQLGSDEPVMAIGGFNGTDPSPTLAQFKAWVAEGKIHYFIPGGTGMGAGQGQGGTDTGSAITSWVESTYTSTTIGGTTVYDLTAQSG
ncbi:MAG TPA: glycosyltransferase family 39 protein [Mycobacteriales bacterium]|jgi:4-amino-4-deoxy-L-arabinose transferase-like glycosyltransferase|nr:glycosyltransferase family 39 protein [Mycobacteriales bacterium]